MSVTAVVGAQWGDEGKGRIVDFLAQRADMVIRYQGGDNAGHTVMNGTGVYRLHLVPSGIFNPRTLCIIGAGAVVNPATLLAEMQELSRSGVDLGNLWLSARAHVVMPYHRLLDGLEETALGSAQIGTTRRGIGPAYADKAARRGIRLGDLLRPDVLQERLAAVLSQKNRELIYFGADPLEAAAVLAEALSWGEALSGRIVDTLPMIREAVLDGQEVLLEGQLGVMRDLDWGTYPYVTSSNPLAGGAGAGLPPRAIDRVIGVVKAYCTAVGAGPFPTELLDETGARLREVGEEFGATTGRPRRCGWFDGVAIGHAAWLNGFTSLAVTKLDVLDGLPEIKICTGYRVAAAHGGASMQDVDLTVGDERAPGDVVRGSAPVAGAGQAPKCGPMPDTYDLAHAEPIYESWPGWQCSTLEARTWDELPKAARAYLGRIAELAGAPIQYVSVGPKRDQLIVMPDV